MGPMSEGRQRLGMSLHQPDRSGWLLLLSLCLHLAALGVLLMRPSLPPPAGITDPLPVAFITEGPVEASAAATAPAAPELPAEPAEAFQPPAPAPAVSPPVQQAEVPPEASVAPPDTITTIQPAEIPLPAQAPATALVPPSPEPPPPEPPPPEPPPPPRKISPPRPVPPARAPSPPPRRSPPQRIAPVRSVPTGGTTVTGEAPTGATDGGSSPGRTNAANNGAAWMGRLKQWWDQNSFYPREASQINQGGNVRVHIAIAGDGRVLSIEVVQSSGSSVLDGAALAVFRNARLPLLPAGTPPQPADVVVTLHYRPSDGGR